MTEIVDVFVSHSHKDKALAQQLVRRLKKWGISVYADLDDMTLPTLPSEVLAARLAERLRGCRLLIFAFSEKAARSRWMPWELGLAACRT